MSSLEFRHLRLLHETVSRAERVTAGYRRLLEEFVLEMHEQGASQRGLAEQLGVSKQNVETWIRNARRQRDGRE